MNKQTHRTSCLFVNIIFLTLASFMTLFYLLYKHSFDIRDKAAEASIPAFPGAEGFGANTPGGRGGKVYEVTNLNDSGEGSLRYAIEAEGARIVVFKLSGTIELESPLIIKNPYITIAGQTAPGDGICLRNYRLEIKTHDVIIRYIRSRLGDKSGINGSGSSGDSISIANAKNVIIDHCSASWSIDETLSVTEQGTNNVTVQWTIIAESLNHSNHHMGNHGYGSIIGGNMRDGGNISFHHNLYAHHQKRNPRISSKEGKEPGPLVDFRNNVIYNWKVRCSESGEKQHTRINYVSNYIKPGPATNSKQTKIAFYTKATNRTSMYMYGNVLEGFPEADGDNWNMTNSSRFIKLDSPFNCNYVSTTDATSAYVQIIDKVGANYPIRDQVDERIINDVINETGDLIDSQDHVGGWPVLKSTTPPEDSDHDGMPNDWEALKGLDPNSNDSRDDRDNDGYTNIEEYINNLVEEDSCQPDCLSKTCGDDNGCGGKCTYCPNNLYCDRDTWHCRQKEASDLSNYDIYPSDNPDGKVNMYDLAIVLRNWKWRASKRNEKADINKDGEVNIYDVSLIINNWTKDR